MNNWIANILIVAYALTYSVRTEGRGLEFPGDVSFYSPGEWMKTHAGWEDEPFARDALQNGAPVIFNIAMKYSPPNHFPLAPGLNDTAQVLITLINDSDQDYDLNGKSPQNWFKPQIFDESSDAMKALPYLDSSQVKYRFRRIGGTGAASMKVGAGKQNVALIYDVWDLPVGQWQLVMRPSANIPNDVHGRTGGNIFVNFPASNMMDSIAAYEGCFWRLWEDGDTLKARAWIDTILQYNESSFVGWGLTLELAYRAQDSTGIVDACDFAIKILEQDLDPTVPHTNELGNPDDQTIERRWYEHYLRGLRATLGGWTN